MQILIDENARMSCFNIDLTKFKSLIFQIMHLYQWSSLCIIQAHRAI